MSGTALPGSGLLLPSRKRNAVLTMIGDLMKAKISAAFLMAVLLLGALSLRAQSDCYSIQCPSKIFAPCEGVYGAHVSFSVTVSNLCDPSAPPTVTYSIPSG